MIVDVSVINRAQIYGDGYIGGIDDGIVTIGGKTAINAILVYEIEGISGLKFIAKKWSLANGHYLITGLDPNKEYLVMCRDHERQYEPFCWDYVRPATDLTFAEQLALWQSWQS